VLLALVLVAVTIGLAYRGWSFYQLSAEDRVEHPDYRTLKASGLLGNGYGWVAALLIVLNLSYLVRRRFGQSGFGKMQTWLDLHVFTGLVAATLVSFHSAFQLRTPVATTSTASLAAVVVTGLIGRFLYALAPTGIRERLRDALDAVEAAHPGHRAELSEGIAQRPGPTIPANSSLLRSVLTIPKWRRAGRDRAEVIDMLLPPKKQMSKALRRARKDLHEAAAADARASGMSALLRSWRGLHRFFALLMLAAVLLHAGVAWYYGYRWIFA
jgi:cytochrome b561